jgi:hypothetical protein
MLPLNDAGGTIASIQIGGQVVAYQTNTVKGEQYVVFAAQPGDYVVTYSDYVVPIVVTPTEPSSPTTSEISKPNTTDSSTATTIEAEAATLPADTQSPISIKSLTQGITPVSSTGNKSESNPIVTVATVVGAAVVVVGGGAGIWVAAKRYRQK